VKGTNTIFFISKDKVPKDRAKDVSYGCFRCDLKPNKTETHCRRLVAGGDRVNYPGSAGTPSADMTLFKILLNSIISTKGARCVMVDIKDFYLCTPMKRFEYMRLKITDIPEEIIREYELEVLATSDGYVHCEIQKGMYGLPQAGIIAQELLEERLAKYGYHQSKNNPWFLVTQTRPICFILVVDDFAIQYINEADATHLIEALKREYTITVDKEATKYTGLTIEWDCKNGKVHAYMPGYLRKAMICFDHEKSCKIQNSLPPHKITQYCAKTQYAEDEDESPPPSTKKRQNMSRG
jgi:hypothetical protein